MKLAFIIARRYLFAKKSQNVINLISMISVTGVFTGTVALLVIMSVFNGLHGFVGNLFGTFDPDLKITPAAGKVFTLTQKQLDELKGLPQVAAVTGMLADNGLLKYGKRQMPAIVMGVDEDYVKVTGIDSIMETGNFDLHNRNEKKAFLGAILSEQLGTRSTFLTPLTIYAPKRSGSISLISPERSFQTEYAHPAGSFLVKQVEYDANYVLISLQQARTLFEYDSLQYSALGIKIKKGISPDAAKQEIRTIAGEKVLIRNKFEQHESFFKMMQVEKLMAFLILSFILLIAAFNIIGSMSMLIFEKKESIFTLKSMGADQRMITRIFLIEGWMISLSGIAAGLIAGSLLVYIQQHFGIIRFSGMGSYILDAYPVQLQLADLLAVGITVSAIGILAAWYPVTAIVGRYYHETKD